MRSSEKGDRASIPQNLFLVVTNTEAYRIVRIEDLAYCTAYNSSTQFHMTDKSTLVAPAPISYYEELLKAFSFVRIHNSTIINVRFLSSVQRRDGAHTAVLTTGIRLPVARARRVEVSRVVRLMSAEGKTVYGHKDAG